MFADISPRYDLLNRLLSLGVDRAWRRRVARELRLEPGALVLDACTGTADLAIELARAGAAGPAGGRPPRVVGADFTPQMVRLGEAKRRARCLENLSLVVADSLALPFPGASFDAVTVAFGIRNVADLEGALDEMLRILKPGGTAAILEFSTPERGWLRLPFGFYFHRVLPRLGQWISRSRSGGEAYTYLPESVGEFPPPERFSRLLVARGFTKVRHIELSFGIAALHLAASPAERRARNARPALAAEARARSEGQ